MKLVNDSNYKKNKKSDSLAHGLEKLGNSVFHKEPKPETIVINSLERILDNRYFMLCDTKLERFEDLIPLILVGVSGIRVIYPSSQKGIFRVEEDNWEVIDDRARKYRPGKPNLQLLTKSIANAVEQYLDDHQFRIPKIEPVLIFTHPGVHIEINNPAVRIILSDAIDRFAASIAQDQGDLNPDEVKSIVSILQGEKQEEQPSEIRDTYSFKEEAPPRKPVRLPQMPEAAREEPELLRKVSQRAPFSKRQWMLLTLLLVVNILILIVLVLVVLSSY